MSTQELTKSPLVEMHNLAKALFALAGTKPPPPATPAKFDFRGRLDARAAEVGKTIGVEISAPALIESYRRWGVSRLEHNGATPVSVPSAKLVVYCATESNVTLAEKSELATLRDLSKKWESLYDELIRVSPTSDRLREIIAADAKLAGTPSYRGLDIEGARQIAYGEIREVKKKIELVTTAARPVVAAIAQRVRTVLETQLDQSIQSDIVTAQEQGLAYGHTVLTATLQNAIDQLERSAELGPGSHPTRSVLWGVIDLLISQEGEKPK